MTVHDSTVHDSTVFAHYEADRASTTGDEFFGQDGSVQAHWRGVADSFNALGMAGLRQRQNEIARQLEQEGVTIYPPGSAKSDRRARRWRLDAAPLVLPADEWNKLAGGIEQRARLFDAILVDLYGRQRLLHDRDIPRELILSDPGFVRACHGIQLRSPRQLILSAFDLTRSDQGEWLCYGAQTERPRGVAYALENRRILARVFPSMFRRDPVRRLAPFLRAYRTTIQSLAPPHIENPAVVVLSPGSLAESAFEHGAVAARLGYPLVEGSDLRIREGKVWLRTVSGHLPVHVILRQMAPPPCDPLELESSSTIGVPGLVDACRDGEVAIINSLGSAILENRGLETFLPALARKLLGEELTIPNLESWWCGQDESRSHVLTNLSKLIVYPVTPGASSAEATAIDAGRLSGTQLAELRAKIEARPEHWVGQTRFEASTAPVLVADRLVAQPTVIRTFAVADGESYQIMPGGLARTAADSSRIQLDARLGARTKDVWILGSDEGADIGLVAPVSASGTADAVERLPARAAENLFWLGRYAERAEATVRLLRAVNQRRADFQDSDSGPGIEALTLLLRATTRITFTQPGFVGDEAEGNLSDPAAELFSLVADGQRTGTVAHAIERMLTAIDVVRDQLSLDTWLVVGSIQRQIEELDPEADKNNETLGREEAVGSVLDDLLHRLLSLSGLATESMVRDQGWHFMDAGRRVERAMQSSALIGAALSTELAPIAEGLVLESVATATENIITYRRRYTWQGRVATLLDLLVSDPGNPRSVRFQLDRLADDLEVASTGHPDLNRITAVNELDGLRQLIVNVDTDGLAQANKAHRRDALSDFTDEIRTLLTGVAEAVRTDYFFRQVPQRRVNAPVERPRSPK